MKLVYDIIMGFVAFSAVAVLFASLIALASGCSLYLPRRWSPMTLATHDNFPGWLSLIALDRQFPIEAIRASRPAEDRHAQCPGA